MNRQSKASSLLMVLLIVISVQLLFPCARALPVTEEYDYVDNNVSDVDASMDKGTHSDFAAQQYGPDGMRDALTEADTGGNGTLDLYADAFDNNKTGWSRVGTSPYLDTQDYPNDFVRLELGMTQNIGDFGFQDSGKHSETINSVMLRLYAWKERANDKLRVYLWDGSSWWSSTYNIGITSPDWTEFDVTARLDTWAKIDGAKIYLYGDTMQSEDYGLFVDCAMLRVDYTVINYELDLEVQWTDATYDLPHEELCIFGGAMGSEDIRVDVWNGSGWHNLFTDLSSGWNNISVTNYLVGSIFTIRFKGGAETADASRDSWEMDCTLLHTWAVLPIALFSYTPKSPYTGETVTFDASSSYDSDGTLDSYFWDFDDGTKGTGMIKNHTFMSAGTYNVTLTVVDNDGYNGSISDMITVYAHDVAIVSVTPSATEVNIGQEINITVTVKNNGSVNETFSVTLYYDDIQIGKQTVSNLTPGSNIALTFNWNTTGVSPDTYAIKAVADTVPGETDTADNTFEDGYVEVKAIHDIGIIEITASQTTVTVGQTVNITVVVKNEGLVSETFNVTSYYNNTVIGAQTLVNLDPGANQTLLFVWNTTGVSPGSSIIKAVASNVKGETDTKDNTLIDGAINVLMVYVHDVAVVNVTPSATEVDAGQVVNITVTVKNEGNTTENFNVTLYYDNTAIGTQTVVDLEPGTETSLRFSWDTTDVTPDVSYSIKAEASGVAGETDADDNIFLYDPSVRVKSQVTSEPFDWSPILPSLVPIFAVGVLVFSVAGIAWKKREVGEGFEFFNEITGGGIPPACSVMIVGGVKSGKSILCQQLVQDYLSRGKACVYVNYDSFPEAVRETMRSFHWGTSEYEEKGTFKLVDCYSSTTGIASQEKHQVGQPFDLSDLSTAVSAAMKEVKRKPPRVFLDSTTPLFASLAPLQVTKFLQDYSAKIKRGKGVFFFTVGKGTIPPGLMRRLEEIVDCIIELDVDKERGKTWKRMSLIKLRGRKVADIWIPFKIEMKKGITFFPPKS